MANLEKSTSIYIDAKNLLFDTDKYVLETIYNNMKDREEFQSLFTILEKTGGGKKDIPYFINQKKYKNPIVEIIQMSNAESTKGLDVDYIADLYYNYILYALENENMDIELAPTNLANAIRVLLKNDSLEKIFVYVEIPRPELCDTIYNFFTGSTKVFICTGNRADMFKEHTFDTYILEDINDIESLFDISKDIRKDIMIPNYKYNFDDNGNIKIDVKKGLDANMSINSINLPL